MEPNNYTDNKPLPRTEKDNPLETMQPGEAVVCVIKRHPIGLLGIYFIAAIVIIAALAAAILAPGLSHVTDVAGKAWYYPGGLAACRQYAAVCIRSDYNLHGEPLDRYVRQHNPSFASRVVHYPNQSAGAV